MALFEAWEVFIGMIVYAAFVSLVIYFCIKYQKPEINEDDELDLENEQEKQVKILAKYFVLKTEKQSFQIKGKVKKKFNEMLILGFKIIVQFALLVIS